MNEMSRVESIITLTGQAPGAQRFQTGVNVTDVLQQLLAGVESAGDNNW